MTISPAIALLHRLDPERAHRLTVAALAQLPGIGVPRADARLAVTLAGLHFAHPVGLAAGFDKDARAIHAIGHLGFAAGEVGTLTPIPQDGNPKPRLFRLVEDRAVINRMGFNNGGQALATARLARVRLGGRHVPFGVNIGANKTADDRIADYVVGVRAMAPLADWLTVNISSPNTPGLRALQDEGALDALLAAVRNARQAGGPPIFLKVAPDLDDAQVAGVTRAAIDHGIDALIVANTTISRPPLTARDAGEVGGLSGEPLAALALDRLRAFNSASGGAMPLIAAGGIGNAVQVWERLAAGASLVQLYSALVYEGPWLPRRIVRDLGRMLDASGKGHISDIADMLPPSI